jgi:hypothetical protein
LEWSALVTNVEDKEIKGWNTLPATFCTLKQLAEVLLTVLSFTYTCESLLSVMKHVKSDFRNRLIDENSAAWVKLIRIQPLLPSMQISKHTFHAL